MNIHKNARLTVCRRQELVVRLDGGEPLKRLARVFAVPARTARKWRTRYREEGVAGLIGPARSRRCAEVVRSVSRYTRCPEEPIASSSKLGIVGAYALTWFNRAVRINSFGTQ
jgi:transposase-like protein